MKRKDTIEVFPAWKRTGFLFGVSLLVVVCFASLTQVSVAVERSVDNDNTAPARVGKAAIEIGGLKLAQETTVSGRVTDSLGRPLSGVTVSVKGQASVGVSTDIDGLYVLRVPNTQSTIVFSLIGFETLEVPVGEQREINATLSESTRLIDEAVVVGFATQKRSDMVGSVVSVKPGDLRVPASNLTTALAGRISGMIAYQRTGEPGMDNADFFIRGVTSFGVGKVDPLILIDGVELSTTELARLRPDDIESFSVMKDATATAVYGARGANGVILVTTKQGVEGRAQIEFRSESSLAMPTTNVQFADPVTYMEQYNDAFTARNPFAEEMYPRQKIDATAEGRNPVLYPANDWREIMFKESTLNHRHNLSVRGGGKVARYYVAGSFSQDNGILRVDKRNNFNSNVDLKSYTLRSNVDVDITKSTQLIIRLSGNFDNYTGPRQGGGDVYNQVVRASPVDFPAYYPVDTEHEHVQHIMFGGLERRAFVNPYAQMVSGYRDYDRSLLSAQMELKQDLSMITDGLAFRTMFNTNRISRFEVHRSYNPFYYQIMPFDPRTEAYSIDVFNENTGTEYLGFANVDDARQQVSNFYMESALNYSRVFNDRHSVSGMLVSIIRSNLSGTQTELQLSLPSRNFGVSGRATYGYDSRYFAEFNFGYNGSERFHKSKRFGFFPSAGVAWSISNEKFWEPMKNVVSNLRLRGTYGVVGNDAIGSAADRFFYLSNVDMNTTSLSSTFGRDWGYSRNGIVINRYANEDITWETAYKSNLALEIGLFNKVQIQADLFRERRENILMDRADIPTTMGLSAPIRANVGEAKAEGMDVSINYSHAFTNGVWLQAMGNFTYATAKFSVYEEPAYETEWWKSRVGSAISQPYGYLAERLFVDDSEVANTPPQLFGSVVMAGDIKYKDVNGDGQITALDMVPLGFPTTPEIVYGFGFSLGYKGFDVSAFFQGLANESFWMGGSVYYPETGQTITGPYNVQPFVDNKQIIKAFSDSHFSLENPDVYALYPRLSTENHDNNMQLSSWWLQNGAFLRLKQAEIGWSLPDRWVNSVGMKKLRLYTNGTNLLTMSHFKLWDVEMGGNGLGYPVQRVFNIGINASF